MIKTTIILLFSCCLVVTSWAQSVVEMQLNSYLDANRHNPALLRAFFQQMPKGGDLHHHYSGSVYPETFLKAIEEHNFWINVETYVIAPDKPKYRNKEVWFRVNMLQENGLWGTIKEELLQRWSIKDYARCNHVPPDRHFFDSFGKFSKAKRKVYAEGLQELKRRAKNENLQYLETMFVSADYEVDLELKKNYNAILIDLGQRQDAAVQKTLAYLDTICKNHAGFPKTLAQHHHFIDSMHRGMDDASFTIRFQNYVTRVINPLQVFKDMLVAFESADKHPLIVGVNIVAPENNETSMRDYWLHMQMFRYCSKLYPNVKHAMHAGELTLGMVKPEDLSWHIGAAVNIAEADRIGHGIDIMYEANRQALLAKMKEEGIAVEINLSSNEFILGIKDYAHPVTLYEKYGVPIVISTDDAGILRTDLTEQYVLLAHRYSEMSYTTIKRYVYNSITYSFLNEEMKLKLKKQLDVAFDKFETLAMEELNPFKKK